MPKFDVFQNGVVNKPAFTIEAKAFELNEKTGAVVFYDDDSHTVAVIQDYDHVLQQGVMESEDEE